VKIVNKPREAARLLIIDDDVNVCMEMGSYFTDELESEYYMFDVSTENEAANSIQRIRECNPHIVILDHHFATQKMNGEDVFINMLEVFRDEIRDKKLGLIYYSNKWDPENASITDNLYTRVSTRSAENKIYPAIRLRSEFKNFNYLSFDVLGLLTGLLDSQDERLRVGECDECCLFFDFFQDSIYMGKHENIPQLANKPSQRRIMFHLASNVGKMQTVRRIQEGCFSSGMTDDAIKRRMYNLLEAYKFPYQDKVKFTCIEGDRKSLMLHEQYDCICPWT